MIRYLHIVLFLGAVRFAVAQPAATDPGAKPYVIDFDESGSSVYTIRGESIGFQYRDVIGEAPTLPTTVYNWKHEEVAHLALQKSFGVNHYSLTLADIGVTTHHQVYSCESTDEHGKRHAFYFRCEPHVPAKLSVNISSDVIALDCDDATNNVIDFYGVIQRSNGPYRIAWYVLNDTQSDLLYQPLLQTINVTEDIPSISVEKAPPYYVVLFVTDACGNEGKQMVHVVCGADRKKVNTIFFERIPDVVNNTIQKSN